MKKIILLSLLSFFFIGCSKEKQTLYVFCWSDYIDPEIIVNFEDEYNCHVSITTFDSNESAYAKLKAGANGYDVMFPSSYMVELLKDEDLIIKLDHEKLENVSKYFCHDFDSQIHDKNLTYSIPYLATYTGLMYDKNSFDIKGEVSWNILLERNIKYSLLDDIREVMGIGLMINGYSLNSENADEIEKATDTIIKMKKNIRKFDAESYKTEIANGSLKIGHGYSSDSFQVIIGEDEESSRDDIGFVLPKEGFTIAFDEMVIMKTAKNKNLAYNFINYMYKPENSLKNMVYNFSPCPNNESIKNLPEKYKNFILLDKNILKRGQVLRRFKDENTNELYNKAWDKIRAIDCK